MAEKDDLNFNLNSTDVFNYRVCALIHHKNKFLLHKPVSTNFWNMIGGRVKFAEDSQSALVRELKEELHIDVAKEDLKIRTLNENFFWYLGHHSTEILIVYDYEMPENCSLTKIESFEEDGVSFAWFNKENITREKLKCIPVQIYDLVLEDNWVFKRVVLRED